MSGIQIEHSVKYDFTIFITCLVDSCFAIERIIAKFKHRLFVDLNICKICCVLYTHLKFVGTILK